LEGFAPDYYLLIKAARYLRVEVWELAKQPTFWRDAALLCERAEAEALEAGVAKPIG